MSLYNFKCPKCNHSHNPDDYDLWEYWNYADDEFDLIVKIVAKQWH